MGSSDGFLISARAAMHRGPTAWAAVLMPSSERVGLRDGQPALPASLLLERHPPGMGAFAGHNAVGPFARF